jgi:hypothetical protein
MKIYSVGGNILTIKRKIVLNNINFHFSWDVGALRLAIRKTTYQLNRE